MLSISVLGLGLMSSCRKYVEVESYTTRALKYTSDYQYLLNNQNNFSSTYLLPLVSNDDVDMKTNTAINTWGDDLKKAYTWSSSFYTESQQDAGYNNLYKQIYISNEIIAGVMDSQKGTEETKRLLMAEAKIHRAYAYLMLANQYAPVYNPESASNQEGLPLLLTPDLFQDVKRASLKQVYDQIIDDVVSALPNLPDQPSFNYHPAKGAAYALLSRCYLYMRDFDKSGENAELALGFNSQLMNLPDYVGKTTSIPRPLFDTETILFKKQSGTVNARLSDELIALYDSDDARLKIYVGQDVTLQGYKYIRHNYSLQYIYVGLRVPELILNRAESFARLGNTEKAIEWLNLLRKKRFSENTYKPLTTSDINGDPLKVVLQERRRELVGTGLRWFDQRRLTLDPGYLNTVTRTLGGVGYSLDPSSLRYVYPVPEKVLEFNPEIGQNPQ